MCKKGWVVMGLALILSVSAWAQDSSNGKEDGHKVNWDSTSKIDTGGKSDLSSANSKSKTDTGLGKEYKLDPWGNEVRMTCPHGDFSQFNYKFSPEQEARLKAIKDEVDQKTKGYNWIVLDHYKKIKNCEKGENSQEYYDAWRQINRIEKVIRDAHAELDRGRLAILTLEQRNLEEEKQKALGDHRRSCIIRHKDERHHEGEHHEEKHDYPYDYLWQQAENYGVFNASELLAKNPPKPEACCDDMKDKDKGVGYDKDKKGHDDKDSSGKSNDDWNIKKDNSRQ